jgi:4-hydroxythreonine-4-phosphate dehydrogenase
MPTSKYTKTNFKKVALTTGDPGGIGFEVSAKALAKLGPQTNIIFFLYRDHLQQRAQPALFKLLDKNFLRLTFTNQTAALHFFEILKKQNSIPKNILFDLALSSSAAHWVVDAANACLEKKLDSLVTGPLSKTLVKASGLKFMGHTGAFRQLRPKSKMHMAFAGKEFNVLLASDHMSLESVPKFLNKKTIADAITAAKEFKSLIGSKKKIAILGLNPHAGESGMIGSFEKKYLSTLPKDVDGPLVPDAAFLKSNWKKYSVFICLYHDQGLIPFKLVHGQDSGVHITMGLPFVRTSVDHGTAFDLYKKNLANPASMLDAINLNLKLIRR